MSSDEPTGRPEDASPPEGPDRPWVAPADRPGGSSADETPTATDALGGATLPEPGAEAAAAPGQDRPRADFPPPSGPALPPPGAADPGREQPVAASAPPPGGPMRGMDFPPPGAPATPLDVPPGPEEPAGRRGNPIGLIAFVLAIVALIMAVLPIASFVAGLPALAAIVLGIIGLVLAGRRRGFATAGLVIGAVALIVAIAVSTIAFVGFVRDRVGQLPAGGFPSTFPSEGSGTGGSLGQGTHTVVYRVTGSGTAAITYSAFVDGRSATARDRHVALPRTRTQHLTITGNGAGEFVLAAITLDGTRRLGCSITIDGRVVASNESGTTSGVELVTCQAHSR